MFKNEHIFEFYLMNNNKKEKKENKEFSEASKKILSCILAIGYDSESLDNFNLEKVIEMIILENTRYHMLLKKEEIDKLLEELKENKSLEAQIANKCIKLEVVTDDINSRNIIENLFRKYKILSYTPRVSHLAYLSQNYYFDGYETILDHVYGTLLIALAIKEEYNYFLDYRNLFITLLLHETDKIIMGDSLSTLSPKLTELTEDSKEAISQVLEELRKEKEYIKQLIEYKKRSNITMEYASLINRLEYLLQSKIYELRGMYIHEGIFNSSYEEEKNSYYSIPCLRGILEKAKKL